MDARTARGGPGGSGIGGFRIKESRWTLDFEILLELMLLIFYIIPKSHLIANRFGFLISYQVHFQFSIHVSLLILMTHIFESAKARCIPVNNERCKMK